jgi:pectin methylesterase-like acyl-CoA thioesterase
VNSASPYGFLISNSTINTDGNPGSVSLGRPYVDAAGAQAQVTVRNTILGAAINTAQPWKDWSASLPWTSGRFTEYQNSGPGSTIANPATRPQLSDTDAPTFTVARYLAGTDGWVPTG